MVNYDNVDHVRTTWKQNEPLISDWRQKQVKWAVNVTKSRVLFLLSHKYMFNVTRTHSVFQRHIFFLHFVWPAETSRTWSTTSNRRHTLMFRSRFQLASTAAEFNRRKNIWRSFDTSRRDLQPTWLYQRPADAAVRLLHFQTNATDSYFEASAPVKVERNQEAFSFTGEQS